MNKRQKKKIVKKIKKSKYYKWLVLFVSIILITSILLYVFVPTVKHFIDKNIFGKEDEVVVLDGYSFCSHETSTYVVSGGTLPNLKIHMIDVNQGDSIYIEFPDGQNMLIDSGSNMSKNNPTNKKTINYLNNLGVTKLDYVLATHSDEDHIGQMKQVFETYEIENVFRPYVYSKKLGDTFGDEFNPLHDGFKAESTTYSNFLTAIKNEQYTNSEGELQYANWEFFNFDSDFSRTIIYNEKTYKYNFDFITPSCKKDKIKYNNANDYSPYVILSLTEVVGNYENYLFKMLLTGDGEEAVISEFCALSDKDEDTKNYFDVDVLKVGHHGSHNATNENLINVCKPEVALISVGEGNDYGHPHTTTLNIFNTKVIPVYRTDVLGSIVVDVGYSINDNNKYYTVNYS